MGAPPQRSTIRRLVLGYALLLVLFAGGTAAALFGLLEGRESLRRIRDEERQVRAVLEVATTLRDQYAHEAHMVILGDDSHLHMYEMALKRLGMLHQELEAAGTSPEVAHTLDSILASSRELDGLFREKVLPAIRRGDGTHTLDAHSASLQLVLQVQARADRLAAHLTEDIAEREVEAARVRRRTTWAIGSLLGLAVILALGLGRFAVSALTAPLERVRAAVSRWSRGELDARIALDRPDELGTLAAQLDEMAGALVRHQQERLARERLAAVGRLAAGVAHEINNPLGVILGYAKLLAKEAEGEQRADLEAIVEEAGRAQAIVQGLLDLSRPWPVGDEALALGAAARKAWQRLAESGQVGGLTIEVEGEATVRGNALGLEQVIHNLLKNAAEASRDAPGARRVRARVQSAGGHTELEITDEGPGLDPEIEGQLFEPFATRREGGTGLGLAVSRAIVEAHGGSLHLGASPGGGACATVRLPMQDRSKEGGEETP
ncbi:MAG: ATP-binding protein [Deltaproteobacteria bacterium]|nr:ATP-binding protein [Deltaproteobacteria bacterium]